MQSKFFGRNVEWDGNEQIRQIMGTSSKSYANLFSADKFVTLGFPWGPLPSYFTRYCECNLDNFDYGNLKGTLVGYNNA